MCGAPGLWHLGRARPDMGALGGRSSRGAWPRGRRPSRRSSVNPRGVWTNELCLRRGQLFTAIRVAGGKVIHNLRFGSMGLAAIQIESHFLRGVFKTSDGWEAVG